MYISARLRILSLYPLNYIITARSSTDKNSYYISATCASYPTYSVITACRQVRSTLSIAQSLGVSMNVFVFDSSEHSGYLSLRTISIDACGFRWTLS